MLFGFRAGGVAGLLIGGGVVAANVFGAPEVEIGEGATAIVAGGRLAWLGLSGFGLEAGNTVANGALLGGALGGSTGMTAGLLATPPTCIGGN